MRGSGSRAGVSLGQGSTHGSGASGGCSAGSSNGASPGGCCWLIRADSDEIRLESLRRLGNGVVRGKSLLAADAPRATTSVVNWRSIRLELGCTGEFPSGSVSRAYLIRLPLDGTDAVDEQAFLDNPEKATVRRHWSTDADQRGLIVRSGKDWGLRCDGEPDRVLRLNGTPLRLGLSVSMVEPDGTVLPFTIASVR